MSLYKFNGIYKLINKNKMIFINDVGINKNYIATIKNGIDNTNGKWNITLTTNIPMRYFGS